MEIPDARYAVAPDGAYIAYQVVGDSPIDVVWQADWPGNIDMEWEEPLGALWFREVASFARVILHDRRGIGLSSRNVALPNLETRVSDLLTVMDAVGSKRPILTGLFESGAPNALLAASKPERVHSMVWMEPSPRFAWAPDYPWGRTPADMEAELRDIELWGSLAYGRALLRDEASRGNVFPDYEAAILAKASRNACTPDVARVLAKIWYESDIRGVLPAVQVPTTILTRGATESDSDQAQYVASLIPGAELREIPGDAWTEETMRAWAEEIRRVAGVRPPAENLNRVLATVVFTDIVGSTERLSQLGAQSGARSSPVMTSALARRSNDTEAATWIPRATDSWRHSTALLVRSDVPRRSVQRSATSGYRSGRACTRARWNLMETRSGASRSISGRGLPRSAVRQMSWSHRPSRTWWPVRAWSSRTAANTS